MSIAIWVGLGVLLVVIFLLVRSAGTTAIGRDEKPKALPEEPAADEKAEPADGDRPMSLKEIKAARAAKVGDELKSKEALLEARQARKGKSRATPDSAGAKEDGAGGDEVTEPVEAETPPGDGEDGDEVAAEAASPAGEAPAAKPAEDDNPFLRTPTPGQIAWPELKTPGLKKAAPAKAAPEAPAEAEAKEVVPADEAPPEEVAASEEALAEEAPADEAAAVEDVDDGDAGDDAPAEAAEVHHKTLKEGLEKTRTGGFVGRLRGLFSKKKKLDDDLLEQLEEVLFTADIGTKTGQYLLQSVETQIADHGTDAEAVWKQLREETERILLKNEKALVIGEERPYVLLVIGVNGVGKTTTIGKLAARYKAEGLKVLLVAGDTFRAAAVDQLKIWGDRVGCEVFAGADKADPSSVVFDGLKRAEEGEFDLVLVDTAGRLHTKVNLIEELKKVNRVCDKAQVGAPHQTLLVLDANTGQNAISQAEMFSKEIGITGLALTKLDGTAKGGVVIGISDSLQVPVQFIGIGEQVEDLREFHADEFVDALF